MLNTQVFETIQKSHRKILLVTKYWDAAVTQRIYREVTSIYPETYFWLWENRIEAIIEKNIPREHMHFIGNIQSQKIPDIVKYCWTIHSLWSLKHAIKIENQNIPIRAFVQIKLDENKNIWITQDEIWEFLSTCSTFKNLQIIWISGMGAGDISEQEKQEEFQKLIYLRDMYMPKWYISAGTSRDYEIALKEWIDIVRVGSALML